MQLLEREPSLALLAGYADEARHGEGRLVLVAGEAGVGKSALVEQLQRDVPDAHWSWGACDGLFTPAPSGRCSTWPPSWAGNWKACARPVLPVRTCSALCCARSATRAR
jgi:chloramphenicol 3-O-phosphotransferase